MLTPFATSVALTAVFVVVFGLGFLDDYRQLRRRRGGP